MAYKTKTFCVSEEEGGLAKAYSQYREWLNGSEVVTVIEKIIESYRHEFYPRTSQEGLAFEPSLARGWRITVLYR